MTTHSWVPNTDSFALLHLQSSSELGDEPNDFVVLDVVVSVLHEVPPKHLSKREGFYINSHLYQSFLFKSY